MHLDKDMLIVTYVIKVGIHIWIARTGTQIPYLPHVNNIVDTSPKTDRQFYKD